MGRVVRLRPSLPGIEKKKLIAGEKIMSCNYEVLPKFKLRQFFPFGRFVRKGWKIVLQPLKNI
jgi:hypothetical protein